MNNRQTLATETKKTASAYGFFTRRFGLKREADFDAIDSMGCDRRDFPRELYPYFLLAEGRRNQVQTRRIAAEADLGGPIFLNLWEPAIFRGFSDPAMVVVFEPYRFHPNRTGEIQLSYASVAIFFGGIGLVKRLIGLTFRHLNVGAKGCDLSLGFFLPETVSHIRRQAFCRAENCG